MFVQVLVLEPIAVYLCCWPMSVIVYILVLCEIMNLNKRNCIVTPERERKKFDGERSMS